MTGHAEQFLAKLCELAIKLSANQLVIFGSSGRRTFVQFSNTTAISLKIEAAVVLAVVLAFVLTVVCSILHPQNYLVN